MNQHWFYPWSILIVLYLSACQPGESNQGEIASTTAAVPSAPELPTELLEQLNQAYPSFQEQALTDRFFKLADLEPLLRALPTPFQLREVSRSVEDRPIYETSWGEGPTEVLLWTQMHGNEPTATAALFDLFNFLDHSGDAFDSFRNELRERLHLTFLPYLNPDGAERYQRRNALGVDINRDALRLASPEARLLKQTRDRLRAKWGFNLHDQSPYYGVGYPPETAAALSFLAPAYNVEKEVNEVRGDAMQLIGYMAQAVEPYVGNRMARYNDDFEPRAFGDNLQKWGTSTILIESGGYPADPEKQEIRRFNFLLLLAGLHGIATSDYQGFGSHYYESIPFNRSGGAVDLIIREVAVEVEGQAYVMDVAYRFREILFDEQRQYYLRASIVDVGDLSTTTAYTELPPGGLRAQFGKRYPQALSRDQVMRLEPKQLYRDGYTAVVVTDWTAAFAASYEALHLLRSGQPDQRILPGLNPDLLLYDAEGQLQYVVVNGHLEPIN